MATLDDIIYVTGTGGVGMQLTAEQIDGNNRTIAEVIQDLIDNPSDAASISNITVSGRRMTVYLSNGDSFGPFLLPRATFRWRDEWVASTPYLEMDMVRVAGTGVFLVLEDHTAALTFDPDATGEDGALYQFLFEDLQMQAVEKTGTTFAPTTNDYNTLFNCTNVAGCAVTLPDTFREGFSMHFRQGDAGAVSFAVNEGVTLEGVDGFDTETGGKGSVVTALYAFGGWILYGRLAPL